MHHRSTTGFIAFDSHSCAACWKCIGACHRGVFGKVEFLGHRHARVIHASLCTGCRKCAAACGTGAITLIRKGETSMETVEVKKPFNRRAFISVALAVSGIMLPVSGIMNHQLQLEMTQARHFWMSIHNMSATLFSISAILHVCLNRRALGNYLVRVKSLVLSKEAVAAVVLVVGIVGVFASHVFHVR